MAAYNDWPEDFPPVTSLVPYSALRHNDDPEISELYDKAKNHEDKEAATSLINRLVIQEGADNVAEKIKSLSLRNPNAIITFVHAVEGQGKNKIPVTLATFISEISGLEIDDSIVQADVVKKTGVTSSWYRMAHHPSFYGQVQSGREYILVDDVFSAGGTFSELRAFIESNGGKVVNAVTMANGSKSMNPQLGVTKQRILELEKRYGVESIQQFLQGVSLYAGNHKALTDSEARTILEDSSLDKARDRILAARQEGINRIREEMVQRTPPSAQEIDSPQDTVLNRNSANTNLSSAHKPGRAGELFSGRRRQTMADEFDPKQQTETDLINEYKDYTLEEIKGRGLPISSKEQAMSDTQQTTESLMSSLWMVRYQIDFEKKEHSSDMNSVRFFTDDGRPETKHERLGDSILRYTEYFERTEEPIAYRKMQFFDSIGYDGALTAPFMRNGMTSKEQAIADEKFDLQLDQIWDVFQRKRSVGLHDIESFLSQIQMQKQQENKQANPASLEAANNTKEYSMADEKFEWYEDHSSAQVLNILEHDTLLLENERYITWFMVKQFGDLPDSTKIYVVDDPEGQDIMRGEYVPVGGITIKGNPEDAKRLVENTVKYFDDNFTPGTDIELEDIYNHLESLIRKKAQSISTTSHEAAKNSKEHSMSDVQEGTRDPKQEAFINALYQRKVVTNALKDGTLSCLPGEDGIADTAPAVNLVNGTYYHGANMLFLKEIAKENGFPTAEYVTASQMEKAHKDDPAIAIRKGQHGVSIYVHEQNEGGEWDIKSIRLFNVAQTTKPWELKKWAEQQQQQEVQKKIEFLESQYGTNFTPPEQKERTPNPPVVTCSSTEPEKYLGQYLAAVSMGSQFKVSPEQAKEFAQNMEASINEKVGVSKKTGNDVTDPFKLSRISNEASGYCKQFMSELKQELKKQNQFQKPEQERQREHKHSRKM